MLSHSPNHSHPIISFRLCHKLSLQAILQLSWRAFIQLWVVGLLTWGCTEQGKSQSEHLSLQPLDLLIKHPDARQQVEISQAGIAIYASAADRAQDKVEVRIYPDEYALTAQFFARLTPKQILPYYLKKGLTRWPDTLRQIGQLSAVEFYYQDSSDQPLRGLKVALDPGHIAGDLELAELEGKYMKMRANKQNDWPAIAFFEPYLTMITALIIKDSLENLGATVLLTKSKPGESLVGKPFGLWQTQAKDSTLLAERRQKNLSPKQYSYYRNRASEAEIFSKFYNRADLHARADKINAFHPDLTLVIHYNIHSPNWDIRDSEGYFTPTEANYSMAFIPGAFYKGELAKPIDRLSFLRCLLTEDVPRSQMLCDAFIQSSETYTGVKPVEANSTLPYLQKYSIYAEAQGVFARNLFLTRSIWGPICYGESFCQDNTQEALNLSQQDMEVHGYKAPSRLAEVADAYIDAVLKYATSISR